MPNETNIIFFGAPGAGKGTQAKKISSKLNIPHIDTGSLIREAIQNTTELGERAKFFVESGKLVPDQLVIDLIREKLIVLKDRNYKGFILDGFPRTIPQANALEHLLLELNIKLTCVINVQAPEEILIKRLSSRRICSNKSCGAIYNLISSLPKEENKCDVCSSKLYQRKDDTKEAALERLNEYRNKTAPLENFYRDLNLLKDVNGTKDPDDVYNEIVKFIS
ncbi:MAG: adenylate kinase [Candidatus Melainabacteria bacterium RIFCSPHIGHO2_02_FULL_34_12]|nr:MAG: adenylate kinase [Candidatus Melainabacteria bacterium RIFCSPHIGHO2_02_FULL_34_12]